eukprot:m51a1_g10503 hypothetical protein (565) ;mRNA; r:145093-147845
MTFTAARVVAELKERGHIPERRKCDVDIAVPPVFPAPSAQRRLEAALEDILCIVRLHEGMLNEAASGLETLARSLRSSVAATVLAAPSPAPLSARRRALSQPTTAAPRPASGAVAGSGSPAGTGSRGRGVASSPPAMALDGGLLGSSGGIAVVNYGTVGSFVSPNLRRGATGSPPTTAACAPLDAGLHIPVFADVPIVRAATASTAGAPLAPSTSAQTLVTARPLSATSANSPARVAGANAATGASTATPSSPASRGQGPLWAPQRSEVPTTLSLGGERLYAAGGLSVGGQPTGIVDEYDAGARLWRQCAELPGPPRSGLSLTAVGRLLVAVGGTGNGHQTRVDLYDPASAAWRAGAPLHHARWMHAATAVDERRLVVVGGHTASEGPHAYTQTCLLYDAVADTWTKLPPMRSESWQHGEVAVATIAGRVYVVSDKNVEVLDMSSGRWHALSASLPRPRRGHACAVFRDAIYVLGGHAGGRCLDAVERFDPSGGFWVPMPPMLGCPRSGLAAVGGQARLYAVGGHDGPNEPLASGVSLEVEPATAWVVMPSMPLPRSKFGLALL